MEVRITTSGSNDISTGSSRVAVKIVRRQLTGVLLLRLEKLGDLLTDLTIGHLDVVLGVTVIAHEGEVAVVGDIELAHS